MLTNDIYNILLFGRYNIHYVDNLNFRMLACLYLLSSTSTGEPYLI